MNTTAGGSGVPNQSVRDVVRVVVAEMAPEELPLVEGLAQFDDDTAVFRLARRGRGREPLGFGLEEIVALITPVVWIAVDEMVRRVTGRTMNGVAGRARRILGRVVRRRTGPMVVPSLPDEEIAAVRRRILEMSDKVGLDPERAKTLADHVVAELRTTGSRSISEKPESNGDFDAGLDASV